MDVRISRNTATLEQIFDHLKACDSDFCPPLSTRVDLNDYSTKLFRNAERFEAFAENMLVGMVAVYPGSLVKDSAFISNVSVMREFSGQGVATKLLTFVIEEFKKLGKPEIILEVNRRSIEAIQLYKRLGFSEKSDYSKNGTLGNLQYKKNLLDR